MNLAMKAHIAVSGVIATVAAGTQMTRRYGSHW
jgi:hypothetical protein